MTFLSDWNDEAEAEWTRIQREMRELEETLGAYHTFLAALNSFSCALQELHNSEAPWVWMTELTFVERSR